MKLVLIDNCPCPESIAPYVYLVLRDAGHTATSIYRGDDAARLLHAHGKSTQAEIYRNPAYAGKANPPGFSSHELRSDGNRVYRVPRGEAIPEWMVGVDSGNDTKQDAARIEKAAHARGWHVVHPYLRGVELHHWSFVQRPRPKGPRTLAKLIRIRRQLRKATR